MTGCEAFVEMTWIDAALAALYSGRNEAQTDSPDFVAYERTIERLQGVAGLVGIQIPSIPCASEDELRLRAMCLQWAQRLAFGTDRQPTN